MPFPGIAFAVSPAPESGTENTQIVESDSTPAETSSSVQAAAPDSAPAETSDGTQAEATDKETLPLLIIVAGFSNVSYRDDFDWAEAIFNGDESLAAYYDDLSLVQFTFVPMNETCSHESGDTTNKADKANDGELSSDEAALGFVIAGYEAAVTRDYSNMAPTSTCGRMPSGWTNC